MIIFNIFFSYLMYNCESFNFLLGFAIVNHLIIKRNEIRKDSFIKKVIKIFYKINDINQVVYIEDRFDTYLCRVPYHYDKILAHKCVVRFEVMSPKLLDEPIKQLHNKCHRLFYFCRKKKK